jgi:hypothetical protein
MSALRTSAPESSWSQLLPTLSARAYGTNTGGAAGRVGEARPSLQTMARSGTLTAKANMLAPYIGPRPDHVAPDLPIALGGHLSPAFCEWLMGFPPGWTEAARALRVSGKQSCRRKQK